MINLPSSLESRLSVSPFVVLLNFLILVAPWAAIQAADYYVSIDGDDQASGEMNAPFLSISRAASEVQPGDTVWIGPGVYREAVRPAQSGTESARIVFRSLSESDPAVVNGTDIVEGPWEREGNSDVYSAAWVGEYVSINDQTDQIFVDGEMYNLLRWPKETNEDLTMPNNAAIDRIISYASGQLGGPMTIRQSNFDQPDGRWDGAKAWVNTSPPNQGDGQGQTGDVVSTELSSRTIIWEGINDSSKTGRKNWGVFAGNEYYLFDPTPEGLMATGGPSAAMGEREWWVNRETGRLYVRFPTGSAPGNHVVEAKRRDWGFDLSEQSYITVRDLNLFATSITTTPDPTVPADPADPFVDSTGVLIDNLQVDYVMHFTDQNINKPWSSSYRGQSGIVLSGTGHTIRNCRFRWSAGPALCIVGQRHRAYNNLLEDANYLVTEGGVLDMGKGSLGVRSSDHKVGYNTIRSSAGGGLNFTNLINSDQDVVGLGRVHHNLVYDVCKRMTDIGAIYSITDHNGVRVDHNIVHGANGYIQFGIYLDYSTGAQVDHNVVYDSWFPIGGNGMEDTQLNNNVAMNMVKKFGYNPDGIATGKTADYPTLSLYNNIVTQTLNTFTSGPKEQNLTGSLNSLASLLEDSMNADMTARDYSLSASATSAIDKGVVVPGYDDPFLGTAPDIGAYETGREKWEAGYGEVPWYLDDDDTLRWAARGVTLNGSIVLHPFAENAPVENLIIVETSPGVSAVLAATTAQPDEPLGMSCTVGMDAPAPATGWVIIEGTQGGTTHTQAFTFRILPQQSVVEIRLFDELPDPLVLEPGERTQLPIRQYDAEGNPMAQPEPMSWTTTGGGSVDGNHVLQAALLQGDGFQATVSSGSVDFTVNYDVQLNWSRGQPVWVSSSLNENTLAENAVDPDEESTWVSESSPDEWLIVDLGEYVELTNVEILWHLTLFPKKYRVEASLDGGSWQLVEAVETTSGGQVSIAGNGVTGRYLRILGGPEAGSFSRLGIRDLSVLGNSKQGILGGSLKEPAGWRYINEFGWIYDPTPGQSPHWGYRLNEGWQFIIGPGLFLRSDNVYGYDFSRSDWWWYTRFAPGYQLFWKTGWEAID